MAEPDKGTTEKVTKTAEDVSKKIENIRSKVEKFQNNLIEMINKANSLIANAGGNSQKYLESQMKKLEDKYDYAHSKAQEWVNDQIKSLEEYKKDAVDAIQRQFQLAQAYALAQIMETTQDIELPDSEIEKLADSMPKLPITLPNVPPIPVPKPDFPKLPDVGSMINSAVAATGATDMIGTAGTIASTNPKDLI